MRFVWKPAPCPSSRLSQVASYAMVAGACHAVNCPQACGCERGHPAAFSYAPTLCRSRHYNTRRSEHPQLASFSIVRPLRQGRACKASSTREGFVSIWTPPTETMSQNRRPKAHYCSCRKRLFSRFGKCCIPIATLGHLNTPAENLCKTFRIQSPLYSDSMQGKHAVASIHPAYKRRTLRLERSCVVPRAWICRNMYASSDV